MEYSGAGGKLIHEKNRKKKPCDTVLLKVFVSCKNLLAIFVKKYIFYSPNLR